MRSSILATLALSCLLTLPAAAEETTCDPKIKDSCLGEACKTLGETMLDKNGETILACLNQGGAPMWKSQTQGGAGIPSRVEIVNAGVDVSCSQAVKTMNLAAGLPADTGYYISGTATVVFSQTGSWMYTTTQSNDCSPFTKTIRATGFIAKDASGKPVTGYYKPAT